MTHHNAVEAITFNGRGRPSHEASLLVCSRVLYAESGEDRLSTFAAANINLQNRDLGDEGDLLIPPCLTGRGAYDHGVAIRVEQHVIYEDTAM